MKTAFERVVPLVGKEYIIHRTYEEVRNARADEKCVGTAKLIAVTLAVEGPERYKNYTSFPNYYDGTWTFGAKAKTIDANVNGCSTDSEQPLKRP